MASTEHTDKQVGLTNAQLDLIGHQSSVDPALLAAGLELVEREKAAHFREAFRHHWRAVLWSGLLSMALVMDSFDGSLVRPPRSRIPPLEVRGVDRHKAVVETGGIVPCQHADPDSSGPSTACPRSSSGSATS